MSRTPAWAWTFAMSVLLAFPLARPFAPHAVVRFGGVFGHLLLMLVLIGGISVYYWTARASARTLLRDPGWDVAGWTFSRQGLASWLNLVLGFSACYLVALMIGALDGDIGPVVMVALGVLAAVHLALTHVYRGWHEESGEAPPERKPGKVRAVLRLMLPASLRKDGKVRMPAGLFQTMMVVYPLPVVWLTTATWLSRDPDAANRSLASLPLIVLMIPVWAWWNRMGGLRTVGDRIVSRFRSAAPSR